MEFFDWIQGIDLSAVRFVIVASVLIGSPILNLRILFFMILPPDRLSLYNLSVFIFSCYYILAYSFLNFYPSAMVSFIITRRSIQIAIILGIAMKELKRSETPQTSSKDMTAPK